MGVSLPCQTSVPACHSDRSPGWEEEQSLFIDVDCRHPEAVLTPMPDGLSQQQVGPVADPRAACGV